MPSKKSNPDSAKTNSQRHVTASGVVIDAAFTRKLTEHFHRAKKRALTENVFAAATSLSLREEELVKRARAQSQP